MKTTSKDRQVQLHKLEKLAVKLDAACKSGSIDTATIEAAQEELNKFADSLIESKAIGTKVYIVYEVQALIHWVNGNYDEANSLISSAVIVKKNKKLFTETATNLARKINEGQESDTLPAIVRAVGIIFVLLAVAVVSTLLLWTVLIFFVGIDLK